MPFTCHALSSSSMQPAGRSLGPSSHSLCCYVAVVVVVAATAICCSWLKFSCCVWHWGCCRCLIRANVGKVRRLTFTLAARHTHTYEYMHICMCVCLQFQNLIIWFIWLCTLSIHVVASAILASLLARLAMTRILSRAATKHTHTHAYTFTMHSDTYFSRPTDRNCLTPACSVACGRDKGARHSDYGRHRKAAKRPRSVCQCCTNKL